MGKLQEGMGDGLNHIIAIYGHEMAFLPQRCPHDMPMHSTASPGPRRPAASFTPGPALLQERCGWLGGGFTARLFTTIFGVFTGKISSAIT